MYVDLCSSTYRHVAGEGAYAHGVREGVACPAKGLGYTQRVARYAFLALYLL